LNLKKISIKVGVASAAAVSVLGLAAGQAQAQQNYYGSIAVSPSTGRTAYAINYGSSQSAVNSAVSRCGYNDCRSLVWFVNSCGAAAYSRSTRYYSSGYASSRPWAEYNARKNNAGAQTITWACTSRYTN
jgi:hypothetical protein